MDFGKEWSEVKRNPDRSEGNQEISFGEDREQGGSEESGE